MPLPLDLLQASEPWAEQDQRLQPANVELRDQIDTYYPVQHRLVRRLRAGEGADWLHDLGLGLPGAAFVGWGLWSPFNLPAATLPFADAWAWGMALRLFAAMAGTALLARALGTGRVGATVAGTAYGLSGFMVLWLGWPQSHVGAAIPWTLWAVHRTMSHDRPWWAGPALALSVATLWLGGFPAVAAYALLAAGLVAAHAAWTRRAEGPRAVAGGLWSCLTGVAVGTGLAAFTLLPSLAMLAEFSLGYRDTAWATALPARALLTFLVPDVYGDVVHDRLWLGVSYVEAVGYTGLVVVGLAGVAWLVTPRRLGLGLYTAVGAGFLGLVYGVPPLPWLLSHIPLLRGNVPTRGLALVCLASAMLGGLGADALLRLVRGEAVTTARDRRIALGALTAGTLALLVWRPERWLRDLAYQRLDAEAIPAAASAAMEATTRAALLVGAALLLVLVAFALARRQAQAGRAVLGAGLVALVATDLLTFAAGWNVQADRALLFPDAPGLAELAGTSARHRVAGADGVLMPNVHLEYGIADVRAHGFVTQRQDHLLARLGTRRLSPTLWDLRSVDSGRWQPWLQAMGVSTVLTTAEADRLGGLLVQPVEQRVDEPLWGDRTLELEVTAPREGDIDGVLVRVGTYGRRNRGELVVRLTAGSGTVTGGIATAELTDLAWAFVDLPALPVAEGDLLSVAISSTSPTPGQAVTLFGAGSGSDGERFRPALALHYGGGLAARPLPEDPQLRLVALPDALPVVHAVGRGLPVTPGVAPALMAELGARGLRHRATVEPYRDGPLPRLPEGGPAQVRSWRRDGGVIDAAVHSASGAVLMSLDQALRGWSATIDGRPAPVVVVNHVFTGVVVPPGDHRVRLRYEPPLAAPGRIMTAGAAATLAAWSWLRRRRVRRSADSEAAGS